MKATIQDIDIIKSINPLEVAGYLRTQGWQQKSQINDIASIWTLEVGQGENVEILLPLNPDFRDFTTRMMEVLQNLEIVEHRSQLEIINNLKTPLAEIIQISVNHSAIINGSIPISQGIQLFESAKKLMWSAASSAVEPRPYFKGSFSEVTDYMQKLRLGHTKEGSYVLTIISPLQVDNYQSEDCFERKVTKTLFQALNIISLAPEQKLSERENVLDKAIEEGVSANLCDALSRMINTATEPNLSFNLTGSKIIERTSNFPLEIKLNKQILPVITEVKNKLKSRTANLGRNKKITQQDTLILPLSSQKLLFRSAITGLVIKLEWFGGDEKAKVIVITMIENREEEVVIEVNRQDYLIAIQANLDQLPIICNGSLIEENEQLIVREVQKFSILRK
ncbi:MULTISPECIES: hypothetical protein [Aphanizomenonaceae]|uniref:Uncharacterized protein n=1 Tax=Dolichospermum heterosporum TAC447 TaxID=747523 RepID=A0ABY5LYK2_9CYAN|nr:MULTISPECIES: hypothetical protein [Aphanizomenonaceae]MBE9258926.1 hypothetical protein [Dolichospermum sp. LEGE 00246]MDK2411814.1 hypothetical protein [Aphanizomenon sp. 202]MDK2458307.1 hypothetical protein [Aphanizomenon sp. PH219]UUO16069.1 hypothetical protein NG743_03160 [Dolichospermum heterosporum TAC447]